MWRKNEDDVLLYVDLGLVPAIEDWVDGWQKTTQNNTKPITANLTHLLPRGAHLLL